MRLFISYILVFAAIASNAQQFPIYENYEWEKETSLTDREENDLVYYYNKYLLTIEYEYDRYYDQFFKYHTEHYRVMLSTDAAIEEFNKIYIPMEDVYRVEKVKARVIKADDVVEVDIDMEEFYSEDEGEQYNYFPITGLEKGDELEILFVLKKSPSINGDQFYFQEEVPIYNFDFRFVLPNESYMNFAAHNGLPKPELVDTILQKHQYDIHLDTIPAFKREYFSEYNNVTMKLDASLKGSSNSSDDYSPYEAFSDYANFVFNKKLTGKDIKTLTKLNARLEVSRMNSQKDNIRKIENYMKNEFLTGYGERGMSIAEMVEEGKGDGTGALQLFMGLLTNANIPFQYGLVSNRYDSFFSPDIESDYFLQEYFIYFPEVDAFLAPLDFATRFGYLDYSWVPNYGLYMKSKSYPVRETSFDVKKLISTSASDNRDSTIITIDVNESLTDAKITIERHITGYDAGEEQVYYYLYSDARKKETQDDLLNVFRDNSSFKLTSIKNTSPEDAFAKPLIIKGEVTSLYVPLLEKAGNKTIFRLGEIFGEYVNPKDIDKKKTDFVFAHPIMRSIEVVVNFPRAVKIKNTEQIPSFDKLVELDNIRISSQFTVTDKQFKYKQRDEYQAQRYSIEDKAQIMKIFQYHDDIGKVSLIIE